jgi:hypothetical protein
MYCQNKWKVLPTQVENNCQQYIDVAIFENVWYVHIVIWYVHIVINCMLWATRIYSPPQISPTLNPRTRQMESLYVLGTNTVAFPSLRRLYVTAVMMSQTGTVRT